MRYSDRTPPQPLRRRRYRAWAFPAVLLALAASLIVMGYRLTPTIEQAHRARMVDATYDRLVYQCRKLGGDYLQRVRYPWKGHGGVAVPFYGVLACAKYRLNNDSIRIAIYRVSDDGSGIKIKEERASNTVTQ